MILDRSRLEAAYITFSVIFDGVLTNTPAIYPQLATVINNAGPITQFKWMGRVPVMTEWDGQRVIQKLRAEGHELRTRWYANGIELDVDDLGEDKLGLVRPRISQLAAQGVRKLDAMVIDMYNRGFGGTLGLTYDGQYLFDTDHTVSASGGTSQSNVMTGAFSAANLNLGLTQFMGFKDENGEPLELNPDTILLGPSNQLLARQVLTAAFGANGASNVDQNVVKAVINARISGAYAAQWYLYDSTQDVKAVLLGIQIPPQFAELVGWDQYQQFMNRTMLMGAHMKVGTAYGQWAGVAGSTG